MNNKRNDKSVTILSHDKCLSCRSCEQSCSVNAIAMKESSEGFLYPEVDDSCINCGLCVKHCPVLSPVAVKKIARENYVTWIKDEKKLGQSTSGGMFTAFAENCINSGGYVFGCVFDRELNPYQALAENTKDLIPMKGSKYVESDTRKSFSEVRQLLNAGRMVLYSGTPCQVAGLRAYLGKEYDNLLTIDLICHGVPSRKIFKKYLEWMGKKLGEKIIYIGFRDKDVGGWSCGGKTKTKTKTKTIDGINDPYYWSFLHCETYRESCYGCPYADIKNRPADITIGDFFEVEKIYPEVERTKGVSLLILNTKKGCETFENIKEKLNILPIKTEQYLSLKDNLVKPSPRPNKRDTVYKNIDSISLGALMSRLKAPFALRLKMRIIKFVPRSIKTQIKKIIGKK